MFCDEKLRKIKFRAFLQEDGPCILPLKSVNYFGTSEHYSGRKKRTIFLKLAKPGWLSVVNFHCMQMGLVMSMRFIQFSAMIEMMCHVNHFCDLWQ